MLDTRELGRRPGTQRTFHRVVPAPADLGIDVLAVPEGSDLELDLRLEAVVEGVLVTGEVRGALAGECVRCLEPLDQQVEVRFQELYVHADEAAGTVADTGNGGDDDLEDQAMRLEGDHLDLEPVVRDAVVLALPFQPVCREDCPGLCPRCGVRLADAPDHRHEDEVDPRWSGLAQLQKQFDDE